MSEKFLYITHVSIQITFAINYSNNYFNNYSKNITVIVL